MRDKIISLLKTLNPEYLTVSKPVKYGISNMSLNDFMEFVNIPDLDYEKIQFPDEILDKEMKQYVNGLSKDKKIEIISDTLSDENVRDGISSAMLDDLLIDENYELVVLTLFQLEEEKINQIFDEIVDVLVSEYGYYDTFENYFDADFNEVIVDPLVESLYYLTTYGKPSYEDVDLAVKCKLIPFYYENVFYLALGGFGMDLSPKYEAYFALYLGMFPRNAQYLPDTPNWNYYKNVVGNDVASEVEKITKLDTERYIIEIEFPIEKKSERHKKGGKK